MYYLKLSCIFKCQRQLGNKGLPSETVVHWNIHIPTRTSLSKIAEVHQLK